MSIAIIVITIIVIANDVGDNFKYLPIIVFPWYFLLPHDPFVPFQQLHHMASIASRKGCESKSREKVFLSQVPGSPNLLSKDRTRGAMFPVGQQKKEVCQPIDKTIMTNFRSFSVVIS